MQLFNHFNYGVLCNLLLLKWGHLYDYLYRRPAQPHHRAMLEATLYIS